MNIFRTGLLGSRTGDTGRYRPRHGGHSSYALQPTQLPALSPFAPTAPCSCPEGLSRERIATVPALQAAAAGDEHPARSLTHARHRDRLGRIRSATDDRWSIGPARGSLSISSRSPFIAMTNDTPIPLVGAVRRDSARETRRFLALARTEAERAGHINQARGAGVRLSYRVPAIRMLARARSSGVAAIPSAAQTAVPPRPG